MRVPTMLAAVVGATALAGCGGSDDARDSRAPDAVGTVTTVEAAGDAIVVEFAPDAGYEYFDGTQFEFAGSRALETAEGEAATVGDVAAGDRIEVWVDACAESFPVQCAEPVGRLLP